MILSICICTLEKRKVLLDILLAHLNKQIIEPDTVEILIESDRGEKSVGEKSNRLYQRATGKYIQRVDDDDWVSDQFIYEVLKAATTGPDAIAMNGTMTLHGRFHATWDISMYNPYTETKKNGSTHYLRFHNHLSPIKSEIAKAFPFPDKRLYEDYEFAQAIHDAGAIKSEIKIAKPMYEYRFINDPNKHK